MPPQPSAGSDAPLQWLDDRAAITGLFPTFARAIDENARAGAWYGATLARTGDGWRIESIAPHIVWNAGEMIGGAPPRGGMPPERPI